MSWVFSRSLTAQRGRKGSRALRGDQKKERRELGVGRTEGRESNKKDEPGLLSVELLLGVAVALASAHVPSLRTHHTGGGWRWAWLCTLASHAQGSW